MSVDLDALEQLARAATQGLPWRDGDFCQDYPANAAYIAAACNAVPELVRRLRAAEAVANAATVLCDLWTYPLSEMDTRLVWAREALRDADVAYRRAVEDKK
jgi:hypothetical protein